MKQKLQVESAEAEPTHVASGNESAQLIKARISEQGDKVRELKTSGAAKVLLTCHHY